MRNLDNFRQAIESPTKSWNSMGYICPKNTYLQLKHYVKNYLTLLTNITFNYRKNPPNSWCHFWNHKSFFTTQLICILLAQTLHIFYKNILSKWKFSDFPLLNWKFTNFLMSYFKQKVSFSSKFGSIFSVMRENSHFSRHKSVFF